VVKYPVQVVVVLCFFIAHFPQGIKWYKAWKNLVVISEIIHLQNMDK